MYTKILEIDLSSQKSKVYEDSSLFDSYLGGTGVATELLHRYCPYDVDPLGEGNVIIFAIGPFSNVFPVERLFSFVLTKAGPFPGLTC